MPGTCCLSGLDVRRVELDPAPGAHAVIRQAGVAGPDDDEVQHVRAEILVDAVLHAAARAQQQHQHENAPEHAEGGQHGAQLVLPQREEDFLQAVQHSGHRSRASSTTPSRRMIWRSV